MSPACETFVTRLRVLNPEDDQNTERTLYALSTSIKGDACAPEVFPAIFLFFERYPEADVGAPGPLVHLIEQYRGRYEALLLSSLEQAPMHTTVWMLNRILNAPLDPQTRHDYLQVFKRLSSNPEIPLSIREQAAHFYAHQLKKG